MNRLLLATELAGLFVGLPLLLYHDLLPGPKVLYLFAGCAYCLVMLLRDRRFDRAPLSLRRAPGWRPALRRVAIILPALLLLAWVLEPDRLFFLVREKTGLWVLIMFAYPLWSAYPQEIAYRAFFFHRYRPLLRSRAALVAASTVLFAFGHIIFYSWLALALTLPGGLLFCRTWLKTGSINTVTLEHALLGNIIFTVGLGHHFFALSK